MVVPGCGGCTLQHWADASYAAWKRGKLVEAVARAGFQPVLLSPVNFESLYQSQRQQAIQQAVEQASGEVPIQ